MKLPVPHPFAHFANGWETARTPNRNPVHHERRRLRSLRPAESKDLHLHPAYSATNFGDTTLESHTSTPAASLEDAQEAWAAK